MKTDVQLQRDVLDELNWDPSLGKAQIGVTVHEGVVTLTGHIAAYVQKHHAEEVTKCVHGVRAVANEIEVRPPEAQVRDDEEIASAAVHAMMWNANMPDQQIQIAVEDGWVSLEGIVEKQFQRVEAERTVRHLQGVRGVTNSIVIAPREDISEIKRDIESAMGRSAALHNRKLSAELDGSTVILSGDVHSFAELEEAVRIAWAAPGIRHVHNCLTVTPWGTGSANEWGY